MTRNEYLQQAIHAYTEERKSGPVDLGEVAKWAIDTGRWKPTQRSILKICQRELATALRQEYIPMGDGKRVRAKHAFRTEQGTFWGDLHTISWIQMGVSARQRRQQIVSDCFQLKNDVDYYNKNHPDQEPIQMVFDFRDDMAEMELEKSGTLDA